jgi:hypothetical protein
MLFSIVSPEWRNWQTRRTQNPVAARPCGFDPLLRDHFLAEKCFTEFLEIAAFCRFRKKGYWAELNRFNIACGVPDSVF